MIKTYTIKQDPRTIETAASPAKERLQGALDTFGFIPNMYTHMANMPPMLDMYIQGYDGFREQSGFTPVEQEVVFLVISKYNGCPYCLAAHSFVADAMSGVPPEITDAIREGGTIGDPKLAVLAYFTLQVLETRGRPTEESVAEFMEVGYSESQILAIITAIAVKVLSNWSNLLCKPELDEAFASRKVEDA